MNIYTKVKDNFSNANDYTKNSIIQNQVRKYLLEQTARYSKLINYHHLDNLLNIGVRDFSEAIELNNKFKPNKIDIADISLPKESKKYSNINTFKVNFDYDLNLLNNNHYDLIFSNMSFQWSQNFEILIENISQKLNNHSILAFSTVLDKNFSQISGILRTNKMHSMPKILDFISKAKLKCLYHQPFYSTLKFDHFRELIQHLKTTGVNTYTGNDNNYNYTKIKKLYMNSGTFKLDYHVGIFICFKE